MGNIYRPKLKSGELGSIWWLSVYEHGRRIKESTGTTNEQEAKRILKVREGAVAKGEPILPRADKVTFEQALDDLRANYEATGKRDLAEFERRIPPLVKFFQGRRISTIIQSDVDKYTRWRQSQGRSGSTARRELGTLVTLLRLAYQNNKLMRVPILTKPEEGDPRSGFFEREQFETVYQHLPKDRQVAITLMLTFGWRRSEVLGLQKRQLDLAAGTVRLDVGRTKNGEGRVVYLTPHLTQLLGEQLERVKAVERDLGRIIPHVFPHLTGAKQQSPGQRHVAVIGEPIRDFRRAWKTACTAAGCPGMLKHDLRRTAARNLVNLGVPERVAMQVTGHKTRSVFDRYHIVAPSDLQEAARKMAAVPSTVPFGESARKPRRATR